MNDVDHPKHYQGQGLECIDVIEAFNLNFCLGNAIKYILRAKHKGKEEQDIHKAIWYLHRHLESARLDNLAMAKSSLSLHFLRE